jgi:hypothetical protein
MSYLKHQPPLGLGTDTKAFCVGGKEADCVKLEPVSQLRSGKGP